jgi:hypothetical protein
MANWLKLTSMQRISRLLYIDFQSIAGAQNPLPMSITFFADCKSANFPTNLQRI